MFRKKIRNIKKLCRPKVRNRMYLSERVKTEEREKECEWKSEVTRQSSSKVT